LRHVAELDQALANFDGPDRPTIVAGDINDVPGSAPWLALQSARTDAFAAVGQGSGHTFSARNPTRRIDGVFASGAITVVSARVIDDDIVTRASDHRPLLVELQF
jgi:endonuclease/exonuclease/phosphatase (EEP) superfamily protein YafD